METIVAVTFLILAAVCGLFLPPTDAEIQARTFKPAAVPEHHSAHHH